MPTMQLFHNRLFAQSPAGDAYMRCLIQLTQARLEQVIALKSTLAWDEWGAEAA